MGGPLVAAAGMALRETAKRQGPKIVKQISKSPAGKKAKQKVVEGFKKLNTRMQQSTSNSTMKDPLTSNMMRHKAGGSFSRGMKLGAEIAKRQVASQGVKGAAVGFGVGLASGMFGNKKKK